MLDRVRAALRGWPTAGCDIEVAAAVASIRDLAVRQAVVEERASAFARDARTRIAVHLLPHIVRDYWTCGLDDVRKYVRLAYAWADIVLEEGGKE